MQHLFLLSQKERYTSLVSIHQGNKQSACKGLGTIVISKGSNRTCAGDTISYTINPVANATSYLWKVRQGYNIVGSRFNICTKGFYSTAFIKLFCKV